MLKPKKLDPKAILATSIIFTLLINTCTVYYTTSDIKKNFSTAQQETNRVLASVAKDRSEKRGIYNQITANLSDSTLAPYPELALKLTKMSVHLKKLKQAKAELDDLEAQFKNLSKGKKKIESNSPLWKNYQSIKTDYDIHTDQFQNLAKSYTEVSNSFVSILNKNKISRVNIPGLRKQVSNYLGDLDKSVAELTQNIEASQKILDHAENQGSNPNKVATTSKSLEELTKILAVVSAKQAELSLLVDQFEKEVGEEPEIWSGPGMRTQTIIQDMTRIGAEIEKQGQKFNALAKKIKH